jgi:hypothetical protein
MPTITTNGTGRHSASYDSLGTLQMLEVSKGILPREYSSWDEINSKIPAEWRDGRALPIPEESMFRTPQAKEGEGGAIFEDVKRDRGNHVMVRDQVAQLAMENGLPVSEGLTDALLPTPVVVQGRNATSGRQPDSKHHSGHTLHDLVFDGTLLPTVKARDASPEGYEAGLRRGMPQLGTMVKAIVDGDDRVDLFPTPIVRDYKDGSAAQERDGKVSVDTVARAIFNSGEVLLGTPRTSSANSPSSKEVENGAEKARLEDQVRSANEGYISWGKFEPAIRRWEETIGRPAPSPTLPDGKDGNHRLSARFTEWMMGLPDGWVTDPALGLSRVEMLKLCGNGVVPQQAKLALEILLEGVKL